MEKVNLQSLMKEGHALIAAGRHREGIAMLRDASDAPGCPEALRERLMQIADSIEAKQSDVPAAPLAPEPPDAPPSCSAETDESAKPGETAGPDESAKPDEPKELPATSTATRSSGIHENAPSPAFTTVTESEAEAEAEAGETSAEQATTPGTPAADVQEPANPPAKKRGTAGGAKPGKQSKPGKSTGRRKQDAKRRDLEAKVRQVPPFLLSYSRVDGSSGLEPLSTRRAVARRIEEFLAAGLDPESISVYETLDFGVDVTHRISILED